MKTQKFLSLLVALMMLCSFSIGAFAEEEDETITEIPRNEALYFGGQQWGTVNSWNPVGTNQNNGLVFSFTTAGTRVTMFETLYMFNMLDGTSVPLLAADDPVWSDDMTTVTITLNDAATWSDGTQVTSADVVKTWEIDVYLGNTVGATYGDYIESIEAVDDTTFVVNLTLNDEGEPLNYLLVEDWMVVFIVAQEAWLEELYERNDGDVTSMLNDYADDAPYSGPYGPLLENDQMVALVRNDDYWGQDESMWGSLPAPTYLVHVIYADNSSTEVAFRAGEIDVDQQYIPNIQELWEDEGLPVSTYMDEEPYGVSLTLVTVWYNLNNEVLQNVAIRKAIAMAVDYDAVLENAMTNQADSFSDLPRSLMNSTEQDWYDQEAVADLQWEGNDIEGAMALLDEAGIVDTDGDGYREYNGEKITLNVVCPNGWTDWQAAVEIIAAAGQNIGLELTTYYPESSTYSTVYCDPDQTEYDIFLYSPSAAGPSMPYLRCYQLMSSDLVGLENNYTGNYGQYSNERVDEILDLIPHTTDEDELIDLYTELVEIYLTDVPSFTIMYRPAAFHEVNESVWTNFPEEGDGIPPMDCTDGYGIAALYQIYLVEDE